MTHCKTGLVPVIEPAETANILFSYYTIPIIYDTINFVVSEPPDNLLVITGLSPDKQH